MIKGENGQAVVIVALLMVVLFGFAALGVDIGAEVARGIKLQQAADSAALAGVTAMAGNGDVTSKVDAFLQANNIPLSALTSINSDQANQAVTVTLAAPNPFYFAPVLGFSTVNINRSATAKMGQGQSGIPNCAIFSNKALTLGPGVFVNGVIHSNSTVNLDLGNYDSYVTGGIESIGGVNISGTPIPPYQQWMLSQINPNETGPITVNASDITMPDLSSEIEQESQNPNNYHYVTASDWPTVLQNGSGYTWQCSTDKNGISTWSISGSNPVLAPGTWYFDGNLQLEPNGYTDAQGVIFATGTITIGGGGFNENNPSVGVALYSSYVSTSKNDYAIDWSPSSAGSDTFTGIMYAPNGIINLGGGTPTVTGSIIGNQVNVTNSITVTATSSNPLSEVGSSIAYLTN